MRSKRVLSLVGAGLVSLSAASLDAAPKLRVQVDQRGDFVLLGNTLAHDCRSSTVTPTLGTVGACGSNAGDSGVDIFWEADAPSTGQARANTGVAVGSARSTAVLAIPAGATITHAYLYWAAAIPSNGSADTTATITRPGVAPHNATAVESYTATVSGQLAYQSVADVTAFVKAQGAGAYRVSGVNAMSLNGVDNDTAFAGWWMAVFYSLPSGPQRNLALFDGLDRVQSGTGGSQTATLSGFRVPNAGYDGKLGVVAFEGDNHITGDQLFFGGGAALSDGLNPANNFFNSTRSHLGAAVSNVGDLPRLTGGTASMSGLDLDVVDVKSKLSPGQQTVQIQATSSQDAYFLGGFITSIATYKPDFTTSTKTATDVDGAPLLVGDRLKYEITVTNTGNDASVNTVLTDPLPAGVTYVPGTLRIESGANSGAKTDAKGDDQAEYDAATRTVTFRLGTQANATQGGKLPTNASTKISFEVTVDASGTISNQATIVAAGELGAPVTNTPTDGNGPVEGNPPTDTVVNECGTDADCAGDNVCKTSVSPHVCVECLDDSHCSGATRTCDTGSNTCVCVPTNGGVEICDGLDNDCDGTIDEGFNLGAACTNGKGACQAAGFIVCGGAGAPVCDAIPGTPSAEVCDGIDNNCDGGIDEGFNLGTVCTSGLGICRAAGEFVCDGTGGVVCDAVPGQPSQEVCGDNLDSDCDGNLNNGCGCLADDDCGVGELCDTGVGATYTCVEGCRGTGGNGCDTGEVCTSTDGSAGQCVQCTEDNHCGLVTSGKVCDAGTNTCIDGCRGDGFGNGCAGNVCTSTDATIGTCVECTEDSHCGLATSGKVCDLGANTCVDGCRGDGVGNGCDPDEVCTSTDDSAGTCVECTEDSHCGDDDSGKVCDTSKNECQDGCRGDGVGNGCESGELCTSTDDTIGTCVECLADSDCGAIDSGSVCDDTTQSCTAGCRGDGFGNGCFGEDVVCTSTDATIGTCVGCVTDADCGTSSSGQVCDTATETCIDGCRGADGNGCEAGEVCTSTDDTIGTCVECVIDADCGSATSGKVCDTATNTCTDGCRGTDGNGCEAGEVCTSTDDTIGTCEDPGNGAGGSGGSGGNGGTGGSGGAGGDDADGGVGGDDFGADDGDVWATGNGVICSAQPGMAGQGAGWLLGGAVVALALARRRRQG